jgi:hypothetical protein
MSGIDETLSPHSLVQFTFYQTACPPQDYFANFASEATGFRPARMAFTIPSSSLVVGGRSSFAVDDHRRCSLNIQVSFIKTSRKGASKVFARGVRRHETSRGWLAGERTEPSRCVGCIYRRPTGGKGRSE